MRKTIISLLFLALSLTGISQNYTFNREYMKEPGKEGSFRPVLLEMDFTDNKWVKFNKDSLLILAKTATSQKIVYTTQNVLKEINTLTVEGSITFYKLSRGEFIYSVIVLKIDDSVFIYFISDADFIAVLQNEDRLYYQHLLQLQNTADHMTLYLKI